MRTSIKTVIFTIGALFFTGGACPSNETTPSNRVAQSEIYQSYSVTQEGTVYNVNAYFRIGGKTGTTLELVAPSSVTFNGETMEAHLNTSSGTYYTAKVPVTVKEGTFVFTDRGSTSYTNRIDLEGSSLTTAAKRATGTSPVTIRLNRPLAGTASVRLDLGSQMVLVDSSPSEQTEAYHDRTKGAIVIMPSAWKNIASGKIPINVEITNNMAIRQGTDLGGDITFRYVPPPLTIAFEKSRSTSSATVASKRRKPRRTSMHRKD